MSNFSFLSHDELRFPKPLPTFNRLGKSFIAIVEDRDGKRYTIEQITGEYKLITTPLYKIKDKRHKKIFYDKRLEIIRKNGNDCYVTDFAILLGAKTSEIQNNLKEDGRTYASSMFQATKDIIKYQYSNEESLVCLTPDYYEKSGKMIRVHTNDKRIAARPMVKYSTIASDSKNQTVNNNGVIEVEYGEYPQMVVEDKLSKLLEENYQKRKLKKTGKVYTTCKQSKESNWYIDDVFAERNHKEYEYNGKKYIRFIIGNESNDKILSDARKTKTGEVYWIEVMPIKWLIDKKEDIALSKFALFSGITFKGKHEEATMKIFLEKYFEQDIVPSKIQKEEKETKGEQLVEIIEEIKKYLLLNKEKDIILNQIKDIVNKYNKELDKLKATCQDEDYMKLGQETTDTLYQQTYNELHIILDKTKQKYLSTKNYYEIIELLDELILMIKNNKPSSKDDEIINMFKTIIFDIIPLIKINNTIKEDILNTLLEEKNKIETMINNADITQYKNKILWEIDFRKKIAIILENILNTNNKQDIVTILNQYLSDNLSEKNEQYTDKLVASHMREIIKTSDEIKEETSEYQYLKSLEEILLFEIDNLKTLDDIITYLSNKLLELYKLKYEIDKINQETENIEACKIK